MAKVEMKKVVSSNVDALGYCSERKKLFVQFLSGAVYCYDGVSNELFTSLITSKSVGSAVIGVVRGGYAARKLEGDAIELELTIPESKEDAGSRVCDPVQPFQCIAEMVFSKVEPSIAPKDLVSIFGNKVKEGEKVYPVLVDCGEGVNKEGNTMRRLKMTPVKPEEVKVFDLSYIFDGVKYDNSGYLVPVVSPRQSIPGCCGGKEQEGCKCKGVE